MHNAKAYECSDARNTVPHDECFIFFRISYRMFYQGIHNDVSETRTNLPVLIVFQTIIAFEVLKILVYKFNFLKSFTENLNANFITVDGFVTTSVNQLFSQTYHFYVNYLKAHLFGLVNIYTSVTRIELNILYKNF